MTEGKDADMAFIAGYTAEISDETIGRLIPGGKIGNISYLGLR